MLITLLWLKAGWVAFVLAFFAGLAPHALPTHAPSDLGGPWGNGLVCRTLFQPCP